MFRKGLSSTATTAYDTFSAAIVAGVSHVPGTLRDRVMTEAAAKELSHQGTEGRFSWTSGPWSNARKHDLNL